MSGKTTLAKKLAALYKKQGTRTHVLDPLCDPTWQADFQTEDNEAFLSEMYAWRNCALIIDESGAAIGRYAGAMAVVATQSRHLGHKAHFLSQRATQLDRTLRDQCSELYAFKLSPHDAKLLSEDFVCKELLNIADLPQGQCYKISRFKPPILLDVFNSSKNT